ncbi:hypothetical protein ACWFOS_13685 [Gordonia terrae]
MKRTILAIAGLMASPFLFGACSDEPPSLEDQLIAKCEEAVRQYADEDLALGDQITGLKFTDMKAELFDGSRPTERWLVSGNLTVSKQPSPSVEPDTWDEVGTTPAPVEDPGPLKCRTGHRKSDGEIVVFEYMQYHPTSGGGIGRQIIYEEGQQTSSWG